jgi:hypothetical protein
LPQPSDKVALQDWCALSSKEILELQKQLAELESGLNFSETAQQLREEIANLKGKVRFVFALIRSKLTCQILAFGY